MEGRTTSTRATSSPTTPVSIRSGCSLKLWSSVCASTCGATARGDGASGACVTSTMSSRASRSCAMHAHDGHRQRLRARDAQRRPDPERGRPRTCGNRTEQAGEAFENVELKGPADNDDGLRLQGARQRNPQQGDVPYTGRRLHRQIRRAFGLVCPIGLFPFRPGLLEQGV